jgi:hypothetical protein
MASTIQEERDADAIDDLIGRRVGFRRSFGWLTAVRPSMRRPSTRGAPEVGSRKGLINTGGVVPYHHVHVVSAFHQPAFVREGHPVVPRFA